MQPLPATCEFGTKIEELPSSGIDIINCLTHRLKRIKDSLIGNLTLVKGQYTQVGKTVKLKGNIVLGNDVVIGDAAYLENVQLGEGTIVKPGAILIGVKIGKKCEISGELRDVKIGNNTDILDAIISRAKIGNNSRIMNNVEIILRDFEVIIGNNTLINRNSKILTSYVGNDCFVGANVILEDELSDGLSVFRKMGNNIISKLKITW